MTSDPIAPPTGGWAWHCVHMAKAAATSQGRPLALAAPRSIVATALRYTDLDRHFTIFPTVAEAVDAVRNGGNLVARGTRNV